MIVRKTAFAECRVILLIAPVLTVQAVRGIKMFTAHHSYFFIHTLRIKTKNKGKGWVGV
jgi:hypothetical protein